MTGRPIEIGQLEWFLPERAKAGGQIEREDRTEPCQSVDQSGEAADCGGRLRSRRPDQRLSVVGGGFPVTVFEAFHDLGGVLRYGIPEFRLPNTLIDDVVGKITR